MAKRLLSGISPIRSRASKQSEVQEPPSIVRQTDLMESNTQAPGDATIASEAGVDTIELSPTDTFFSNEEGDEKVNLSILKSILSRSDNSLQVPSMDSPKIEKRVVTFTGIDSPVSTIADYDKNRDELLSKIDRVEIQLKQAQIDLTAETTIRKKKERNLIKLAKELNKRAADSADKDSQLGLMNTTVATLEAKLAATRTELDERITASEHTIRDAHHELNQAQQKYRDTCRDHDARVTDLVKAHTEQMEELKQQHRDTCRDHDGRVADLVKAHAEQVEELNQKHRDTCRDHDGRVADLVKIHTDQVEELKRQMKAISDESDRLRSKLTTLEVKEAERVAEIIVTSDLPIVSMPPKRTPLLRIAFGMIVVCIAIFHQLTGFSMDAICSPAMAGTRLDKDTILEAPWWAPEGLKSKAFEICGKRTRTSLSWKGPSGGVGRLIVKTLDSGADKILLDRKVTSAIVKVDRLDLVVRKGNVESIQLPWAH